MRMSSASLVANDAMKAASPGPNGEGGTTRQFGVPRNHQVYCFPLAGGSDVSALSRFVHHVVDPDVCTAETVVIVATAEGLTDSAAIGVLNVAIGRLASRHVHTIVVTPSRELLAALDRAQYPHIAAARLVATEGKAALLILDGLRHPR
jgi:hypothetical protein